MGTLDEFVAERAPVWTELEQLVDTAGSKPSRLGADGVRRLGTTYRAAAADLAIARRPISRRSAARSTRTARGARPHRGVPHRAQHRDVARVRDPRVLAPHPGAHRARRDRARLPLRPGRCSVATGPGVIRARRSAWSPVSSSTSPSRGRAARTGASRSTTRPRSRPRSSPTTSASRSWRSRAGSCSASARSSCCSPTG